MRFDLSQSGLKSVITTGIFSLVAIGILLNWAVPVSAQNAVPAKPDAPTLRALHQGMVEVDWNDVSGANQYEVQFYTSSGWIDLPNAGLGIEIFFDGSRAVATGLPEDLGYDAFRVRAGNSGGWSEWSEYAWQMTTHNMDWEGIPVPTIEPTPEPVNTPATGAPAISGTAQVGETLTASTSGIADADGLTNVSYSYQWVRNDGSSDTDITDATDSTYTLEAADEGKTLKVKVSFTDDADNDERLTSAATGEVEARPNRPATGRPMISGTAQVGETLTASTSDISDADGLTNVSYSHQWIRNDGSSDTDITDATESSYTLVAADEGQTIEVEVSFTDDAANGETLTSTATEAVSFAVQQQTANNPATGRPTISGAVQVGETLTADTSDTADADGLTNVSYSYQWVRNDGSSDTDILDATGSTHTLVDADEGKAIKVKVSFTDDADNEETLTSTATATVAARPNTPMTSAQDDTTAPTISSVTITSDPDTDIQAHSPYKVPSVNGIGYQFPMYWYRIGDQITVTVTFTKNITVTGTPELRLNVGTSQNVAIFESANGATAAFEYTVTEGDSDTDGISFPPNGLTLEGGTIKDDAGNDAALSYGAVSTLSTHKVDGIRPILQGVSVASLWRHSFSPHDNVFDIGEEIFIIAPFSEPVFGSIAGPPTINLQIGNESRPAEWEPTAIPFWATLFNYFIEEGDWDPDGVSISAGSVNLNGGYIKDAAGNDAILTHSAATSEWRVDGIRPFVTSIAITSDPGTDKTYEEGDQIEITVTFNEPVFASENNHIEIDIGGTPRQAVAPATTLPAPQDVPFTYTVQKGDHDSDGISITANEITYTDSLFHIKDAVSDWPGGNLAYMEHPALPADTTHKVDATEDGFTPTPQNHVPTGKPTVGGIAQEKLTLSADVSDIGDLNGLHNAAFTYQWIREQNNADTNIPNATSSTYTLTREDVGNRVKVKVSFTDDQDYYEVVTSDPTATVADAPNSPATGAPSINGKTEVHETLAAVISEILDDDGLTNTTFSYQWLSSRDTEIGGATSSTYTLLSADEGKTLKVRVTFTDDAGNEETLTSTATDAVSFPAQQQTPNTPATGAPTISGTSQVKETLTANTSDIVDDDGLTNVAYSYQWITNDGSSDMDIAGETGITYTLIETDEGKTIKVQVAFTDDADNDESLTSQATARVAAAAPTKPPGIPRNLTGAANSDGTVTLSWDAPNNHSVTGYQILRRSPTLGEKKLLVYVNDTGSAATEYTDSNVVPNELYAYRIKAINAVGLSRQSEFISLTPTQPAEPAQNSPATGTPTISGTLQVGETLTADTSGIADADGLTNVTFSYQWIPDDGSFDADNQDPPGSSYTLFEADEGKTIKLEVSFTDDAGNGESLTSAATAAVAARPNTPATGAPTISGTSQVKETLTANTSDIVDDDGLTNVAYSYQWITNDGSSDMDIAGETGITYTLIETDEGKTIKVQVAFTDDADNDESLTSQATARVAAAAPTKPPGIPRNLTGAANSDGTVTLSWDAPNNHSVTGYQILRRSPTLGEKKLLVYVNDTGSAATEYTDSNVVPNELYAYRIKAINAVGLSRQSEFISLTPTQPAEPAQNSPATGTPTISGTLQVGETLTADTSGIADADGLTNVTFSYQWLSDDADIAGATASTYPLVSDDEGKTLKVRVRFADDEGDDESLTSAATAAVAAEDPSQEPPAKPTGLTGTVSYNAVSLSWDDLGDASVTGYQVLRRDRALHEQGVFLVHVDDTGNTGTMYIDTDVEPSVRYVYRIKARNASGLSERSKRFDADMPVVAPDLLVSTPTLEGGNPTVGTSFTLAARVLNQGGAESAATTVRFYRSADAAITTSDTEVGTGSVSAVAASGVSTQSIDLTAPSDAGTYYYGACVDTVSGESSTTNNCSSALTVTVEEETSTAPDLVAVLDYIANRIYSPGEAITLIGYVRNQGDGASAATTVRYYYSTDTTITSSDTELSTDSLGGLAASGTSNLSIDVTLPAEAGYHYYGVCVDAVSGESDTTNNCGRTLVRVYAPDLTVWASKDGGNLVVSESFTLKATVSKNGRGGSSTTTLRYYRSTDDTITTSDTELGTDAVDAFEGGSHSSRHSISLTAPSTAGAYYYGACVDSVPGESDTTNNCSRALQVTVDATAGPDLLVFRPYHSAGNLLVGASFTLNATVKNQGSASSGSTTLRYYRSTDDTITTSDTSVGTDSVSGIASGGTSAQSIGLTAPPEAGTHYYGVCVDSVTDESVTNNNCSDALTVIVDAEPAPDLVITWLFTFGRFPSSNFTSLSAQVENHGSGSSDATTLRFYRSTDEMITTSDTEWGTAAVSGLTPSGTTTPPWEDITRPSEAGTYYFGVCVDAVPDESDTTNNCSNSMSYTVE